MKRLVWATAFMVLTVLIVVGLVLYKSAFGSDLVPDPWGSLLIKGLVATSISYFCWTLIYSGDGGLEVAQDGTKVARLNLGARFLFLGGGSMFLALGVAVVFQDGIDTAENNFVAGAVLVMGGYFFLVGALVKFKFDEEQLSATTFLLLPKQHNWRDLIEIQPKPSQSETHLRFARSGKARIPDFLEGKQQIIEYAEEVLKRA